MSNLHIHKTLSGRTLTVFEMSSAHLRNCIRLWDDGLLQNKYQKPEFIKHKLNLYSKVLQKRYGTW